MAILQSCHASSAMGNSSRVVADGSRRPCCEANSCGGEWLLLDCFHASPSYLCLLCCLLVGAPVLLLMHFTGGVNVQALLKEVDQIRRAPQDDKLLQRVRA